MKRPIRNVREWTSDPRSIALIALGLVYIRVTIIYLPWLREYYTTPLPTPLEILHMPLWVYGIVWLLSGLFTIYVAVAQVAVRPPLRWLMAMPVGIPTLWCTFYAISWAAQGFMTLDWSTAMIYGAFAVIVGCLMKIPPARLYRSMKR